MFNGFLQRTAEFQALELRIVDLPQRSSFQSGIGRRNSRQALLVGWHGANGLIGYGECSCRPDPYYSAEFLDAAALLIERFVAPKLRDGLSYEELLALLGRIRGWPFTRAAVEFAFHDYLWQRDGESLFDQYAGPRVRQVPVGISLGLQDSPQTLEQTIHEAQSKGYRRLKFKVDPDFRQADFAACRHLLTNDRVYFDANGTLSPDDLPLLEFLTSFGNPVEQPFPPHQIEWIERAQGQLPLLRICLDEEVKGLPTLATAHRLHYLDELNLKPGRVGGLAESLRILEYCRQHRIPVWVGGMFETGIGRSFNLHLAALMPDAYAHDLSPSSRYFVEDLLVHPIEMNDDGLIDLHQIDRTVDLERLEKYTQKKILLEG